MRSVMSISLPSEQKAEIERRAKKAGKSISSYIIYAVSLEQNLISEDELVAMSKQAEKDYAQGKAKKLASLADLLK